MLLSQTSQNRQYRIVALHVPQDSARRFEILGMFPGSTVQIINLKHSGARIIRLRGTRYALGPSFCASIEVEEA